MTALVPFARYEVWLVDPAENHSVALLNDFTLLEYAKRTNRVGNFRVVLPASCVSDIDLLAWDSRVVVWRQPYGGPKEIDFAGFLRYLKEYNDGSENVEIAGPDYNDILRRRIVAYDAGGAYTLKTDFADDMMKAIVNENLGNAATDPDRDLETALGLSIAADQSLGTSIEMEFAYLPVLDVLEEIAEASTETEATRVYFSVVPTGELGWAMTFETRVPRWGVDRTTDSLTATPAEFSLEAGNLGSPSYSVDRRQEWTVCYGGGQGEEADRYIVEVANAKVDDSPYNRCEGFYDGRQHKLPNVLTYKTRMKLRENRLREAFSGALIDTPSVRYGLHYGLGDLVTATYAGRSFDLAIDMVQVAVTPRTGVERITPSFEEP